ncbi:hypothetical protein TNCV_1367971 [Trichonephila clavipes]|nr:hypothetical protein TNCV_1367971 [Trichonephila clavipes]
MELTDTTEKEPSEANFRSLQGAHGWSSQNITGKEVVTRSSQSLLFNCRLPLAWHSRMRSARDQSPSLPIDVLAISLQRVPHVEA